jgi:hypothetical protein
MLEDAVHDHLAAALPHTHEGRTMVISRKTVVSDFEQYEHIATLKKLIDDDDTACYARRSEPITRSSPTSPSGSRQRWEPRSCTPLSPATGRIDNGDTERSWTKPISVADRAAATASGWFTE